VSRSISPVKVRAMISSNVRRVRRTSAPRPPSLSASSTGVSTSSRIENTIRSKMNVRVRDGPLP
jgi:hypothetical protein